MIALCLALTILEFGVSSERDATEGSLMQRFQTFAATHNREYQMGTSEFYERYQLFQNQVDVVEKQNSNPKRLWTAAINHMSDYSLDEMKALNGYRVLPKSTNGTSLLEQNEEHSHSDEDKEWLKNAPKTKSWEHLQMAQPANVRSQSCGNCWAEMVASLLEAHHEIHMGSFRPISGMELTECSDNPGHCGGGGGCDGSIPELALEYVMFNSAFNKEDSDGKCPAKMKPADDGSQKVHEWVPKVHTAPENSPSRQIGMTGWQRLPENDYEPLMRALVERGPVGVAVSTDWHEHKMKSYSHGIYDGCSPNAIIGHAVLALGYGQEKESKYWVILNSWGEGWGEHGKMRLLRTDEDEANCGSDTKPALGSGCDGGPSSVKVCGQCGVLYDTVVPFFEAKSKLSKTLAQNREGKMNLRGGKRLRKRRKNHRPSKAQAQVL